MTSIKRVLFGLVGITIMATGLFLSQESVSAFSVSPMKQTISLAPGQTYSNRVTVSLPLDDNKNMNYEVSIVPFKVNDSNNGYSIDLTSSDERNEIVKWVSLSDGKKAVNDGDVLTGELSPGESIDFIYTINVPYSVLGGGQYFAVLVKSVPNSSDGEDNNLAISEIQSIASVVYAELPGEIKLDGTIKENNINGFLLSPPINASFVAVNDGNTHFAVTYYLQVYPLFSDEEIYTNEENAQTDYVLPGTSRYISQSWDKTPSIGIFKVRQTAYIDSNKDEASITERVVVVCPVYLLFLIVFAIIMIALWIVFKIKSRKVSR
ncbi:hypothetical protein IJG01_02215 [Candidatus Saccharibacteria bacterium]|nr:hypothetical protein [Candidatus Saccharibacteria bacterium]